MTELAYQSNQVPRYSGQLSGPARKAGVVAQSDANTLRDLLKDHAGRLNKIARRFEEVDGETVGQLGLFDRLLMELKEIATILSVLPLSLEDLFWKISSVPGKSDSLRRLFALNGLHYLL